MTFQATEGACAFAWRNYLLVHSGISEDDHRRSALHRYLTDLGDAGDFDFDLLQIAAVNYLKGLDDSHDDRSARLAADKALAKRARSRAATTAPPLPPGRGLHGTRLRAAAEGPASHRHSSAIAREFSAPNYS